MARAWTALLAVRVLAVRVVAVLLVSGTAHADRYEASLHAQAIAGTALVGDAASHELGLAPLAGLGLRASYARANAWQYDAQLTLAGTGDASFARGEFRFTGEPVVAPFAITTRLMRLDAGVTWRLGVRVVPTWRLALGVQERWRSAPRVGGDGPQRDDADGRGRVHTTELVGVSGVGLDYRLGPRWVVGGSLGGSVAVASPRWATVEASLHLAYYWYPRWLD